MEFQQKQIKFMAQQYLDNVNIKSQAPLLYKRHALSHRGHLERQTKSSSIFPDIHSGRESRRGGSPGRLQMDLNTDSPGPAAYSPPCVNVRETSAPSYTFGWKTPPRDGGGRRAWQKSWFLSKNPFTRKADFASETNWPSPFEYVKPLGSQLVNRPTSPNFTFGTKLEFSFVNKKTVDDPAPNKYNTDRAYKHILNRSPSFIISPAPHVVYRWAGKGWQELRKRSVMQHLDLNWWPGNLPVIKFSLFATTVLHENVQPLFEGTPGPGAYNVESGHLARLPTSPSFFIQGVRRPKKHETGPFSTL